jgi:hypothetical protein
MANESILDQLGLKGADLVSIATQITGNRKQISRVVKALKVEKSPKKYAYEKVLRLVSEKNPEQIYPYFDVFRKLLNSDNSFLKWGAIMTISNLTAVDSQNRFEDIFRKYYAPIKGPALVTAANIIGSSVKIARAKPMLADSITLEILKVEKANFLNKGVPSPECRNVAIGQAIDAFDGFFDLIGPKTKVLNFIKRQFGNTRDQVVKKAERFMRHRTSS